MSVPLLVWRPSLVSNMSFTLQALLCLCAKPHKGQPKLSARGVHIVRLFRRTWADL